MDRADTIAAISTPAGEGGVGIIRISGPDALKAGQKVFAIKYPPKASSQPLKERHLHYGQLIGLARTVIDDGFMVYMKGPSTYTGSDVVELYLHGSPIVLKKALESVLRSGARLAGPGEFTRQAFLSGRMDLAQAEAVNDIIRAETEAALLSARG
ncbi:MAG: tRNA uridine-5-carboxymethylaminomethyl(34) synthesis GTPase MnmE, partial [Deltaproteobacteria bacterium]|nr:tRNA uridine-5-carboxymethylaminomethyl(34) synthesis GTPase MnmE [Deltaproteobacteria bacterium]